MYKLIYLWILFCSCTLPTVNTIVLKSNNNKKESPKVTVHKDLQYSTADQKLTLDLFLPETQNKPVPCVIVIEGGGFYARDGQRFKPFADYIAEQGYAAALIAYRGRPNHEYNTSISDTKEAVRYIRSVSHKYNIDPDKIGAMGRSAGATLAVLLAVSDENSKLTDIDSCKIQAAVGYAGVYDFVGRFTDSLQISLQVQVNKKIESNGEWIGTSFSSSDSDWLMASAINHVDKKDPPILFLHCKNDYIVPWIQSKDMCEKMNEMGIKSKCIYYNTGGHGFRIENEEEHLKAMMRFFRKVF